MAFHEIRFPDDIAYGASGGPEFATTIVTMASGYEQRNINWQAARGRWDVASGLKNQTQLIPHNSKPDCAHVPWRNRALDRRIQAT